jgi:NAD-dependent DNA ligase
MKGKNMTVSRLLTRKETMNIWKEQNETFLNSIVCPSCRDIINWVEEFNAYYCSNPLCKVGRIKIK